MKEYNEFELTPKERRQKEREGIRNLHGKDRAVHIWMYYKIQIALVILGILVIIFGVKTVLDNRYQDILYVGIVNDFTVADEEMEEYLRDCLGAESKFDTVTVDNALTLTAEEAEKNTGNVRLLTYTAIGEIDVVICEDWVYEALKGEYLNEDGITVSKDNEILSRFGIDEYDSWVVCTASGLPHKERAEQFIKMLTK